ncbi:MAG: hypothetical protein ACXAC0_10520, partial [Candidatus Thorarchaeota archaeon]
FDIGVGQWELDFPSSTNPLENLSLAVAFYSDISIMTSGGMTANATYIDDLGHNCGCTNSAIGCLQCYLCVWWRTLSYNILHCVYAVLHCDWIPTVGWLGC